MKAHRFLILALAASAATLNVTTHVAAEPLAIGEMSKITSKILSEERHLMVYLPGSYERSKERFPVLYVLDGETRFHHTTGTVATLARSGLIPEMIVIGITNTQRTRDLTPPWTRPDPPANRVQAAAQSGGADSFLRFLAEEVIPHVDAHYRTQPYRILVGHSFGGLFAVHALVSAPGTFDATLSISPSLHWDESLILEQASALFEEQPDLSHRLYITLGNEGGGALAAFEGMGERLRYEAPRGLHWETRHFPRETHGSVPVPSVHHGLRSFYPRWQVPQSLATRGFGAVKHHYAALSADYGYQIDPPEGLVNQLGYAALAEGDIPRALELFEHNVAAHPYSANVHDSLGEALEAKGQLAKAAESYRKAIALGTESEDPNLNFFQQHLEGVRERLAQGAAGASASKAGDGG